PPSTVVCHLDTALFSTVNRSVFDFSPFAVRSRSTHIANTAQRQETATCSLACCITTFAIATHRNLSSTLRDAAPHMPLLRRHPSPARQRCADADSRP